MLKVISGNNTQLKTKDAREVMLHGESRGHPQKPPSEGACLCRCFILGLLKCLEKDWISLQVLCLKNVEMGLLKALLLFIIFPL